jgi:Arc/MetJ-type ribon-helix-helix transcriptional regulator
MKHRLSITLDEETVLKLKEAVRTNSNYRNQSHFVEVAIKKMIGGK